MMPPPKSLNAWRRSPSKGKNPVTEALDGAGAVEEWAHFPAGDVIDPATHSQFYYHAHAAEERAGGEHGHFHTFVRPKLLFPDLAPVALADNAACVPETAWVAHLAGISTDASGNLIRLFTTNRWVTDEVWYDADAVIAHARSLRHDGGQAVARSQPLGFGGDADVPAADRRPVAGAR